MNIKEIKECLQNNITTEQLEVLQADRRSGVQKLLAAYYKHIDDEAKEAERFANMVLEPKIAFSVSVAEMPLCVK